MMRGELWEGGACVASTTCWGVVRLSLVFGGEMMKVAGIGRLRRLAE